MIKGDIKRRRQRDSEEIRLHKDFYHYYKYDVLVVYAQSADMRIRVSFGQRTVTINVSKHKPLKNSLADLSTSLGVPMYNLRLHCPVSNKLLNVENSPDELGLHEHSRILAGSVQDVMAVYKKCFEELMRSRRRCECLEQELLFGQDAVTFEQNVLAMPDSVA